jgi:hypothetical protein
MNSISDPEFVFKLPSSRRPAMATLRSPSRALLFSSPAIVLNISETTSPAQRVDTSRENGGTGVPPVDHT